MAGAETTLPEYGAPKNGAPENEALPDPVQDYLTDLHFRVSRMSGGTVASYIPELAKADPNLCGMAIATVDGKIYSAGDADVPAKSGVAGSIMGVIPGQIGIAVFSPPIDEHGNSVRGVAACRDIAETFGLNIFKTQITTRTVIRRELRLDVVRSKRVRDPVERKVLDEAGHRVCILEVQGPLFFGSSERLIRHVGELTGEADHLVLDLRRVPTIDEASRRLLVRLAASFDDAERSLAFAHLTADGLLAALHEDLKTEFEDLSGRVFDDRDAALEWFENRLIAEAGVTFDSTRFSLGSLDLFRGMPAADLRLLELIARPFMFEAGDLLIREGDAANVFFVIARGSVSVQFKAPDGGRAIRLASIGPGLSFGEMAVIDGGRRSAEVVANERVVCYGFSVEALKELGREHPQVIPAIYANMTRDLSERLRRMSAEVRALEH